MPKFDIKAARAETIEFALQNDIKWVKLGLGQDSKKPVTEGWNTPDVYEKNQEYWKNEFLEGKCNLGFICGKASNGLVVLDFDNTETLKKIGKYFKDKATIVKTGSGKYHIYLRTSSQINRTIRIHKGGVEIDVQGEGVQVVAPASIHPMTNKPYKFKEKYSPMHYYGDLIYDINQWIIDNFKIIPQTEKIDIESLLDGVGEGKRDDSCIKLATFFRWQGKTKDQTFKILLDWNNRNNPPQYSAEAWIRQKIESAWKHDKPYHYKFLNTEIYSKEVREQADYLLSHPEDIFDFILEASQDVVDEKNKRITIPLLLFGKQTVEISGESGEGKSHLADISTDMLPKDWVTKITSLSSHSLRHGENYRCLYIAERRGLGTGKETEADYDMKVSISEGKITALVAEKQKSGRIKTVKKEIIIDSFIMTTTEIAPPPELSNRIWNISIDESKEHRKKVIAFITKQRSLPKEFRREVLVIPKRQVLRCLFRMLGKETKNFDVILPFTKAINETLPYNVKGVYRHTKKLLKLMEILTMLYVRKVPRYKENYLIATPEIYELSLKYGKEAVLSQFMGMTEKQRLFWNKLKMKLLEELEINLSDVSKLLKTPYNTTVAWVRFLEDMGLITSRMEGRVKVLQLIKGEKISFSRASSESIQKEYDEWLEEYKEK
jgi:hypothetical protein